MKKILSSEQMKYADYFTINNCGVPSMVLMERAALAVCDEIAGYVDKAAPVDKTAPIDKTAPVDKTAHIVKAAPVVHVYCGIGNNGGDGVAIARILHLRGYKVMALMVGDADKQSEQLKEQITIAKNYGVKLTSYAAYMKYVMDHPSDPGADIIVDAIFGIGLSREVTGIFANAVNFINQSKKSLNSNRTPVVISVDMPSGYSTDTGMMLGVGVKADLTVTFSYLKTGLLLGDCAVNAGNVKLADVGIYIPEDCKVVDTNKEEDNVSLYSEVVMSLSDDDLPRLILPRKREANKGTCGKVLIIAGSENVYGACYLSAYAASLTGSGLVKIVTHMNNIASIQQSLPEAMYYGYLNVNDELLAHLDIDMQWADVVLIGPGLGQSEDAKILVDRVLSNKAKPRVVDADALNVISTLGLEDQKRLLEGTIITPHLMEMSRLSGETVESLTANSLEIAKAYAKEFSCTVVLKNFVTVIATAVGITFINTSGCQAMATAGSGDVLSGIIASLVSGEIDPNLAAAIGTFIHGRAGEVASENKGIRSVLASDIANGIVSVLV